VTAANVELAFALPLGVIANQLMRMESDLRFLSAKASGESEGRDNPMLSAQIAARVEQINETLESIRMLVAEIEQNLQPKSTGASKRRRDDRED
jgi:hypothetical protein